MMSQHKNGGDSVGTLHREMCHFAMIMLIYSNKGPGETYILTYKTILYSYRNLGLVSPGGIISHCYITITSLLPSLSNVPML